MRNDVRHANTKDMNGHEWTNGIDRAYRFSMAFGMSIWEAPGQEYVGKDAGVGFAGNLELHAGIMALQYMTVSFLKGLGCGGHDAFHLCRGAGSDT